MRKKTIVAFSILLGLLTFAGLKSVGQNLKDNETQQRKLTEQQQVEFDYAFIEATKAILLGNTEKGVSLYISCLQIDPTSAAACYELSNVYFRQEDYNSALELIRKAVKQENSNLWYKIQLANVYQRKGMIDHACKVYEELTLEHPERDEFFIFQAALYTSVEKFKEAIGVYNKLEKKTGISENISLEKQRLYMQLGDKKSAYAEIHKLIEKFPHRTDFYSLLAELYLSDNEYNKALKQYQKILKIEPSNALVHFYLSDFYRKQGEAQKANQALLKAFSQHEVEPDVKTRYLIALLMNENQEEMPDEFLQSLLNTLLGVHPNNVQIHTLYADFLMKKKAYKAAKYHLEKVLEEEKSNYVIWESLLLIYNELSDFDKLQKASTEALKYFPNQSFLYLLKGAAEAQKGDYNTAIHSFQQGIVYAGDQLSLKLQLNANMGDAYYKLGDAEKAFAMYDKVLLYEPQNVVVLNNYSYYLSLRGENLDKARKMSSLCVKLEPENSTFLDTHAWVLYHLGAYEEAKKTMEKALLFGGNNSPVQLEHYGDILYQLGDAEKASEQWQQALELGKGSDDLEEKVKTGKIPEKKKNEK